MTKAQFLKSLEERLSGLPREEREERLTFYSEMLDDRMEEGLSEAEAVAAVGSADEIAGQIIEEYTPEKKKAPEEHNAGKTALIIAGSPVWFPVMLALAVVGFSVWIVLWAVVISLWAALGGIVGGAVGGTAGGAIIAFTGNMPSGLVLIAAAFVCTGFGIFLFLGNKYATKGMVWLTKKLPGWCKACFSKKEEAL